MPVQKLHLKETGLQSEVTAQRGGRADAQSQVRKLQCDIAELADAIQDPKALKEKVGVVFADSAGRSRQQQRRGCTCQTSQRQQQRAQQAKEQQTLASAVVAVVGQAPDPISMLSLPATCAVLLAVLVCRSRRCTSATAVTPTTPLAAPACARSSTQAGRGAACCQPSKHPTCS